ncbi:MAG: hypothetical protein LBT40_09715 [Deltaproteobacteria bacterium]|nr:hypothetical protein [Deltaproteobacteria bacterium]
MNSPEDVIRRYSADPQLRKCEHAWFRDRPIPPEKLASAFASFGLGADPSGVLLLVDNTRFVLARGGLLVTRDDVCGKDPVGRPRRMPMGRIESVAAFGKSLAVNGRTFVTLGRAGALAVASIARLVSELAALAGGPAALPPGPGGAPAEGVLLNGLEAVLEGVRRAYVKPSIPVGSLEDATGSYAAGARLDAVLFLAGGAFPLGSRRGLLATRDAVFAADSGGPRALPLRASAPFTSAGRTLYAKGKRLADLELSSPAEVAAVAAALEYLARHAGAAAGRPALPAPGRPAPLQALPAVPGGGAVPGTGLLEPREIEDMLRLILYGWAPSFVRPVLHDDILLSQFGRFAKFFRASDIVFSTGGVSSTGGVGSCYSESYSSFVVATGDAVLFRPEDNSRDPVMSSFGPPALSVDSEGPDIVLGGRTKVRIGLPPRQMNQLVRVLRFLAACKAAAWPRPTFPPGRLPKTPQKPDCRVCMEHVRQFMDGVSGFCASASHSFGMHFDNNIPQGMLRDASGDMPGGFSEDSIVFLVDCPSGPEHGRRLLASFDTVYVHEWWRDGVGSTSAFNLGPPAQKISERGGIVELGGKRLADLSCRSRETVRKIVRTLSYLADVNEAAADLAVEIASGERAARTPLLPEGALPAPPPSPLPAGPPPSLSPGKPADQAPRWPPSRADFEGNALKIAAIMKGITKARVHPDHDRDRLAAALAGFAKACRPEDVYFHVDDSVDGIGETVLVVTHSEAFAGRGGAPPAVFTLGGKSRGIGVKDSRIEIDGTPLVLLESFSGHERACVAEALAFVSSLCPAGLRTSGLPGEGGTREPAREFWEDLPPLIVLDSPAGGKGREGADGG